MPLVTKMFHVTKDKIVKFKICFKAAAALPIAALSFDSKIKILIAPVSTNKRHGHRDNDDFHGNIGIGAKNRRFSSAMDMDNRFRIR